MFADISFFESLCNEQPTTVFNSAAAVLLNNYDQVKAGYLHCVEFIDQTKGDESVPAELMSQLFTMREKFNNDLIKIKQDIVTQSTKEPLDVFDRKLFITLSKETQEDLQSILEADEVYQRALELKSEKESQDSDSEEEQVEDSDDSENEVEEESEQESEDEETTLDDNFGLDVQSEEEDE